MDEDWYYGLNGETLGPVTFEKLLALLKEQPDWTAVPVWRDGLDDWQWARDVHQIAFQLGRKPAPVPETPREPVHEAPPREPGAAEPREASAAEPPKSISQRQKIAIAAAIGVVVLAIAGAAAFMLWTSPLERGFASAIRDTKPALPKKADELTTMVNVTSAGRRLSYQYVWDAPTFAIPPNPGVVMKTRKLAEVCASAADLLKLGGEVEHVYRSRSSLFIGSFVVTSADCG